MLTIHSSKLCETSSSSHLLLISNGSDVSQNALDLLMGGSLADVVLQKATEGSSDCLDVVLTQICIFTSRTRKERENRFDGERKRQNSCEVIVREAVLPVVKANCVQQELHSRFLPELLPAVFDDGGHVLDVTFTMTNTSRSAQKYKSPKNLWEWTEQKALEGLVSFVFFTGISEFWNPSSRLWVVQFFNEI